MNRALNFASIRQLIVHVCIQYDIGWTNDRDQMLLGELVHLEISANLEHISSGSHFLKDEEKIKRSAYRMVGHREKVKGSISSKGPR